MLHPTAHTDIAYITYWELYPGVENQYLLIYLQMCQVTLVGKYTIFHLLYLVRTQASTIQTKLVESSSRFRNSHHSIVFVLTESLSLTGHKMFLSLFCEGDSFLSHYKKGIKILFKTDVIIILMPEKTPSSALYSIRQGKTN